MNLSPPSHLQEIFTSLPCNWHSVNPHVCSANVFKHTHRDAHVDVTFSVQKLKKNTQKEKGGGLGLGEAIRPTSLIQLKDRCGVNLACLINPSRRCRLKFRHCVARKCIYTWQISKWPTLKMCEKSRFRKELLEMNSQELFVVLYDLQM